MHYYWTLKIKDGSKNFFHNKQGELQQEGGEGWMKRKANLLKVSLVAEYFKDPYGLGHKFV